MHHWYGGYGFIVNFIAELLKEQDELLFFIKII